MQKQITKDESLEPTQLEARFHAACGTDSTMVHYAQHLLLKQQHPPMTKDQANEIQNLPSYYQHRLLRNLNQGIPLPAASDLSVQIMESLDVILPDFGEIPMDASPVLHDLAQGIIDQADAIHQEAKPRNQVRQARIKQPVTSRTAEGFLIN